MPEFIELHYRTTSTRDRAAHGWQRLHEWLLLRNLQHPREIRYEHAHDYLAWRKQSVAHNTALYEIHFLAFLLNEAIRREIAERNVLTKIGIGRESPKEKPELSDAQIHQARAALEGWMRIVFEIQLYTGCRFSETSIAMNRIDFQSELLWIEDAKRADTDPRKWFRVPLDRELKHVLDPIQGERTVPRLTREQNHRYNEKLKAAVGCTSHSLRVTFITRCHDAGLSESEAMSLVNHSNSLVHAIYIRRSATRLRSARARVLLPPPSD